MIQYIRVTNHLGDTVKMELRDPYKSGFLVSKVDGLGPVKANINTTESASLDGATYNSAKLQQRNIVMSLVFVGDKTVEEYRQLSYKYFPIKKEVKIVIKTDNRTCVTSGFVESNVPTIFSKQEGTQISILCPDPYFYSEKTVSTVFSGIEPLFEFEVEGSFSGSDQSSYDSIDSLPNADVMKFPLKKAPIRKDGKIPSLSSEDGKIEFGLIVKYDYQSVVYDGDADVGMNLEIHAVGPVNNVTVYNANSREFFKIDSKKLQDLTGSDIVAGDTIYISTVKRNKFATLFRDGKYTNILNCVGKGSSWLQLSRGENDFTYSADSGRDNLQFRIENQNVYEGI